MSKPRVGFLGVGWIGLNRMRAMVETGAIDVAAIVEPDRQALASALEHAPGAIVLPTFDLMLAMRLDGIVIATPSAQHAEQSIRALQAGMAVFCQKPLGRNLPETAKTVEAARVADRLLMVDLSYRHVAGVVEIRDIVRSGRLGAIGAVELVFHNAYGPDKPWFYDKRQSGGGCVMDLGVHLVDLALWVLDFPEVTQVTAAMSADGRPVAEDGTNVEDYAAATLVLATGTIVQLTCSWRLHAGCEAVIAAKFYGRGAGASLHNVAGSFYDFNAEYFTETKTTMLRAPPDAWGGRRAAEWATRLSTGRGFDPAANEIVAVSGVLDAIYGRRLQKFDLS